MKLRLAASAALLLSLCAVNVVFASPQPEAVAPSLPSRSPQQPPAAAEQASPAMTIIADVMIDGRGPFHFLLDTGATQAVIAESTVMRLGLTPDWRKRVRVQGINSRVLAPEVHVQSLTFGSLRLRSIDLPVLSGPLFYGLDGILGAQSFDGMKVSVSLLDRRCIIATSPQQVDTPVGATALPLLAGRLPMVSATIADVQVQVIIDTGATNTMGNMALFAALEKTGAVQALGDAPAALDVTPVRWKGLLGLTAPLIFGQVMVQPPDVTFDDYQVFERWNLSGRPAMLLGMDALATLATFSIDYGRQEVQVVPRPAATPEADPGSASDRSVPQSASP